MNNDIPKQQKQIQIIEDPVEAVRKLPDVYIGALGNAGYVNMYREIIQNSLDEIIKGNTLDKNIIVSFDERTHTCIIEDNGQGIELNMLIPVFSILHSSSNYDKKDGSGEYSSGKNGMGATITNYLSKFFIVESYRPDGNAGKVEFIEGKINSKKLQKIKSKKNKHGLITTFCPSDIMGQITVTVDEIQNLTWLITHLCLPGTRVLFNAIDIMGRTRKLIIENKNGIYELIDNICEKKVFNPIYFNSDNGTMKVEVLFSYDVSNMDDPKILGFANMCPTSAGTHIDGFLDAIIKYFRDYMNKIYLVNSKNKKLQVNAQDIRTGLRAVISTFHVSPMFTGQSKEIFSKEDMKPYIYQVTLNALDNWAKNNPGDLQKVSKYLKEVCEIRVKSDNEKIKMSDKYTASVISGMPAKYMKPNSKGPFEFWIVEGDSCASAMANNRDKAHQSVFPIKGKIINAFTTPTKRYFENEEVASIFRICGYNGYQRKFDPDQFKPSKVVIAADGDADGSHIQCLLFGLFLRYLPFVIEQGKLYAANPPLYGISVGKNKMKFFENNIDYVEYVQNIFCKENSIYNTNKKAYTKHQITKILYDNIDYSKIMAHVCSTYAIDPSLLEFILYNINLSESKFKNAIEKQFRFVNVIKENGVLMVRGLVGSKYQTVFCNERMFADCRRLIEMINNSDKHYIINGNTVTLLGLMNLFNEFEPKNITRYKGLGEMPPKMLGESTVIPGMGRTLKQYTIEDCKKELNYITELQSDKSIFTRGIKIRKEDIV